MGKESVQIRKHIDEERERLDMNIAKLESDFEVARNLVTDWRSPLTLAGIAIGVLVVVGEVWTRRRGNTRQTTGTSACDIAT